MRRGFWGLGGCLLPALEAVHASVGYGVHNLLPRLRYLIEAKLLRVTHRELGAKPVPLQPQWVEDYSLVLIWGETLGVSSDDSVEEATRLVR